MPPAIRYVLDLQSPEGRQIEQAHAKEYTDRQTRFTRHWQYYDGEMRKALKIELDGVDDNVILGKVDQVADKVVSFLLGDGIRFQVGGPEQTEEDEIVEQLWQENRGATLQHNIALAGALTGHCAVRLEPREGRMPRIVHINAQHLSVFWDEADIDNVLWYRLQYRIGNQSGSGKRVDYVKGIMAQDQKSINHDADGWLEMVYLDDISGQWHRTSIKPVPGCPIIDWQNMPRPHAYYGADDVRKAVALNDALNFIASNYARILKHHGSPKTIGIGVDAASIVPSKIAGFYTTTKPKNEADIYNLEMQSDLSSAREFLAILARDIWQSARMVDPQMIKDTVGNLTNFGLRVLYQDALTKTQTKRQLYGEAFELIIQRGLELAGVAVPERIEVQWPDTLPEDSLEISTALLKELEAGILDRQSYRELRGYDHAKIEERLLEEKAGETTLGQELFRSFARGA